MKSLLSKKAYLGFKQDGIAWLETVVIALICILIWLQSGSIDSSEEQHFFWPLFGPLLVSLRYGFAKGFTCALLTTAGLASILNLEGQLGHFPFEMALGTIIVSMIAGEFQDYWIEQNSSHALDQQYMSQKLDSFTQNYHLLKVSHDQLEQRTAGQTVSLRASINALQKIATKHADHRLKVLGQPFLELLADVGGIEVAGIYKVSDGKMNTHADATLGDHHQLVKRDPMLKEMLKSKKLLSPAKLKEDQEHKSRYQLCIPLLDTHGTLQATVLAESAKFFMLTPANVALLSLVANHAADLLSDEIVTPILQPHQSNLFISYLKRAQHNKRHYRADSTVVVCVDTSGKHKNALDSTVNFRRGADVYWSCVTRRGYPALAVLLPLTSAYDAQQYINRLKELLKNQLNADLSAIDVIGPLSLSEEQDEITTLMDEFGAYDETLVDSANYSF